jgi:hypothetical protein
MTDTFVATLTLLQFLLESSHANIIRVSDFISAEEVRTQHNSRAPAALKVDDARAAHPVDHKHANVR